MKFVISVCLALVLAWLPVQAEEEMEFDVDIALFTGDVGTALHAVNSEQDNPTACDIATIAYVPGDEMSDAKGPCGHFRVVRVLLIGVFTEDHGFLFTVPSPYFSMQPAEKTRLNTSVALPAAECTVGQQLSQKD
jgi:hypothetical protein